MSDSNNSIGNKKRDYTIVVAIIGIIATSVVSTIAIVNQNALNQKSWNQQIFNTNYKELLSSITFFQMYVVNDQPKMAISNSDSLISSYLMLSDLLDKKYRKEYDDNWYKLGWLISATYLWAGRKVETDDSIQKELSKIKIKKEEIAQPLEDIVIYIREKLRADLKDSIYKK
jgi:hypothetical protein